MSRRRRAFMFFWPQKGLTFLEVIIALTFNAVAFLGLFQIFNVALNSNKRSTQELIATNLGRALIAEIMIRPFADPQDPANTALGLNAGEAAGDRSTFDDVDDYTGYADAPPKTLSGAVMDGTAGTPDYSDFSRSVSVVYCKIQGASIVQSATPTNMKMITVTVSGPDFNPVRVIEILSSIP